ncbi:MAG: type II toxin-antitoxin system RelE/ParE family toxin [Gemmatimonadaceae bacterium]|nr:type II toxin-antitoxin system RelE/ParE family toxin [Gemmatimonadaceae bacterium]
MHELRVLVKHVHYRVLYFFDGPGFAVLALGCTKEGAVDAADIDRALRYRSMYLRAPARHVVHWPVSP